MSTPSISASSSDGNRHVVPGSGGGISVASLNTPSGSPFILSPPPLPTPQTVQTIDAKGQSTTPSPYHDSRTPMTVQLQRLLQPTPANATPAASAAVATPRPSTPGSIIVPATPSPYTIDQFLQQSGLPPKLSRTATSVVFTVLSWILAIVDVIVGAIVSRFKAWWHNVISRKFPNTADIMEALLEYTVEVCQFLIKAAKFLSPYVVWLVQTLIATVLFIGGSFVCGIIILCKGRDAAENSGAGEVQSSAMKSLNESIQNSPFYSRKAVPFTPRFAMANDRVNDAPIVDHTAAVAGVQTTTTYKSPPATNTIPPKPSASKFTPPVSVMKRHSSFQSNPNTPNAAKPTPKTRRVLFSESEHGQVDTEQFFYDKNMPSARKLPRHNENRQQMVVVSEAQTTDTPPNETSPTNSASNTPVLRPSKFGTSDSTSIDNNEIQQQSRSQVTIANQPSTAVKKQQAQQDEQNKQQYIEKYGLLPSITPLSKRYGRMKRQQGQSFAIAQPSSRNGTASVTSTVNNNGNNNAKRKRRDLLSAASRMGRRRLNNHRTGGSSLPVVLLGKNRTPMKRRREDELNRADEWVWRAMNSDGEKENLDSQGGGATKRTKFGNDVAAMPPGLSTPPKSTKKSFPSVTTPPKTPGPSTFSLESSTPAPKSNNTAGATPAKSPLPSFAFNDTSSSSAGFSFGNNASSSGGDVTGTPSVAATATKPDEKDGSGPSFSFGSTPGKNDTAAPSFSFGDTASKSDDANNAAPFSFGATSSSSSTVKPDEKKVSTTGATNTLDKGSEKSEAFSFGATATPVPATQDTTAIASFSFGSAVQPNTPAMSASTSNETKQTPSFSFGGASAATPSSGFGFGSTAQTPAAAPTPAAAAPSETKQTPSFSFGNSGSTMPASTFSFGSTAQTPAVVPPAVGAAPPMFAFGGQTPGISNPSSFSVGGSTSGASARRRAASGRRK
ncbi:hypothetical protein QTG54_001206 [Skeletonema marinoi]|uniref:Uncharacterized protein n=1 Tax=Skeletonema marinoi TaxID=267567 RepID=A0AAD8YNE6_9STRA|nr:hypothetical protein QTG54_001206 [Skeletonema marinoi]